MKLVELNTREFNAFVKKIECSNFLQSTEMKKRYDAKGFENYLFGVKCGQQIVAAALVVTTRQRLGLKIFKCPGGPIMDYDAKDSTKILRFLTKSLKQFLKSKNGLVLEISPNIVSQPRDRKNNIIAGLNHLHIKDELKDEGYKYLGEYEQIKWSYILPLGDKDIEEMFADLRTDHRQRIRRAKRENVRVRELAENELHILKEIAAEAGQYHGFQDPDIDYYKEMRKAFGQKIKFMVSEAYLDNEWTPLNAAMFVDYAGEIVYLYSGSVRKYTKLGGSHYMQWKMIEEALNKGYKRYNFYGVKPVEGNGVYFFKQGFRGHVEELLGTFMLPLNFKGWIYTLKQKYREFGDVH